MEPRNGRKTWTQGSHCKEFEDDDDDDYAFYNVVKPVCFDGNTISKQACQVYANSIGKEFKVITATHGYSTTPNSCNSPYGCVHDYFEDDMPIFWNDNADCGSVGEDFGLEEHLSEDQALCNFPEGERTRDLGIEMCNTLNNDMDLCLSSYKKWSTVTDNGDHLISRCVPERKERTIDDVHFEKSTKFSEYLASRKENFDDEQALQIANQDNYQVQELRSHITASRMIDNFIGCQPFVDCAGGPEFTQEKDNILAKHTTRFMGESGSVQVVDEEIQYIGEFPDIIADGTKSNENYTESLTYIAGKVDTEQPAGILKIEKEYPKHFRDHVNLDETTKKRQQIVSEYNISNKPTSVCADYCIRDAHCYGFNIESIYDDSSHKKCILLAADFFKESENIKYLDAEWTNSTTSRIKTFRPRFDGCPDLQNPDDEEDRNNYWKKQVDNIEKYGTVFSKDDMSDDMLHRSSTFAAASDPATDPRAWYAYDDGVEFTCDGTIVMGPPIVDFSGNKFLDKGYATTYLSLETGNQGNESRYSPYTTPVQMPLDDVTSAGDETKNPKDLRNENRRKSITCGFKDNENIDYYPYTYDPAVGTPYSVNDYNNAIKWRGVWNPGFVKPAPSLKNNPSDWPDNKVPRVGERSAQRQVDKPSSLEFAMAVKSVGIDNYSPLDIPNHTHLNNLEIFSHAISQTFVTDDYWWGDEYSINYKANEDYNRNGKILAEKYKNRKARLQHASWGSHTLEDYTGNSDIKKANEIGNALVPISLTSGPSGPVRKDLFKSLNWPSNYGGWVGDPNDSRKPGDCVEQTRTPDGDVDWNKSTYGCAGTMCIEEHAEKFKFGWKDHPNFDPDNKPQNRDPNLIFMDFFAL